MYAGTPFVVPETMSASASPYPTVDCCCARGEAIDAESFCFVVNTPGPIPALSPVLDVDTVGVEGVARTGAAAAVSGGDVHSSPFPETAQVAADLVIVEPRGIG